MRNRYDVLIVGGGHAGANLAAALRRGKYAGSIGLVSDEEFPPYERPPLSKEYFTGDKPFERMLIRPESYWADNDVDLLTRTRVTQVEPDQRHVVTGEGTRIGYGELVWAAGGRARMLDIAGSQLNGIYALRTRRDADAIRARVADIDDVVIVGGGYIGLEAAASLTKLGKKVVVVEIQSRVLARVAGIELAEFFRRQHVAQGVEILLGTGIEAFTGDHSVTGVRLDGGRTLPAQAAIVGIGIEPETGPLIAAGVSTGNGVKVDEYCRTDAPGIYSIGDCAEHANRYAQGARIRLESVQNASDMAATVAALIIGSHPHPYDAVPWFWSNQFDLRLQTVGISAGFDDTLIRGDVSTRQFSVVYLQDGRVIALDCVNNPRDFAQGKTLVKTACKVDRNMLADGTRPLKDLVSGSGTNTPRGGTATVTGERSG